MQVRKHSWGGSAVSTQLDKDTSQVTKASGDRAGRNRDNLEARGERWGPI